MRIVLVCPSYYGYDRAIARALAALGHHVAALGYFPHDALRDKVRNRMIDEVAPRAGLDAPRRKRIRRFNDSVFRAVRSTRAELLVVVKGEVLEPDLVHHLTKTCPTAYWAFDDPYRYETVLEALPAYQHIGAYSRADTERLRADGYDAFHLPDGYDSFSFGNTNAVAPSAWHKDVSFVGARYANREQLLGVVHEVADLGIWGGDWKRRPWRARFYQWRGPLDRSLLRPAGPKEADLIYRSCKINLNIHGHWDGLNMRVFEIPGAGGFQLCDERDGLAESFVPGKEIATFDCGPDLEEKVRYYLAHDTKRGRIRAAGAERSRNEHTLVHRMRRLLLAAGHN